MGAAVIGIDLGVTRVRAARLDGRTLGEPTVRATERSDAAALIDQLVAIAETRTGEVHAVGVAIPRIVEFATGRVVAARRGARPAGNGAVDLPLGDVALRDVLARRLGVPVFVDNAAAAAALAEAHDDDLELNTRHLVMLTFGVTV